MANPNQPRSTAAPGMLAPAVSASLPVSVAARAMSRRGIDRLLVVEDGAVCGVLTQRDLVRAALGGIGGGEPAVAHVCCRSLGDLLTPDPLLVDAGATVRAAAQLMDVAGKGEAVVQAGQDVVGVVTGGDVALAVAEGRSGPQRRLDALPVAVTPLSLGDDIASAVRAVAANRARPVPVVDSGQPLGTVTFAASGAASGAGPAARPAMPPPPAVVGRRRGGPRFYSAGR